MKAFAFSCRMFDEYEFFQKYSKEYGIDLGYTEDPPTLENYKLAEGCQYVSVMTTKIDADLLDRFKSIGVRQISTRSIGFDHIDVNHAKEIGMAVTHITYDSDGVAEFTVMDILMAVRRMKELSANTASGDFRLKGMLARQLKDMSVGILGVGKIGLSVLRDLSGFGCKLYYYNRTGKKEADKYAERAEFDYILANCDVISMHLELNDETRHIIDAEAFAKMKKGAIFVNTGRGALVDTEALISSLESGHLGYAALDVIEDEFDFIWNDCREMDLSVRPVGKLKSMPNVLYSYHMAFYYREAIKDMVRLSLYNMKLMDEGKEIPLRLV
jgi:D-lactate dehydrogenase